MAKYDITNLETRRKLIEGFYSGENLERKQEARKRYDVYKDGVKKYVHEALLAQTDQKSVIEMMNRATNVNLVKKIVGKKARVYLDKVIRVIPKQSDTTDTITKTIYAALNKFFGVSDKNSPEEQTAQIKVLAEMVDMDNRMKKVNRAVELHKNCLLKILPYESEDGKWLLRLDVLHPGQYDVLADEDNPTEAEVVVLCDNWSPPVLALPGMLPPSAGLGGGSPDTRDFNGSTVPVNTPGISDAPPMASPGTPAAGGKPSGDDKAKMRLVWWSEENHFMTDGNGIIIATTDQKTENPDNLNPIEALPFVVFNKDQDGTFFSRGGEDLIDATILLNILMTDTNYILYLHGTGLFYYIGPNAPERVKVGANAAIVVKTNAGEPAATQIGFASANPPIDSHLRNIEQLVAVVLSTNDLEPSAVSTRLTAEHASSGIHELIKGAEVTTSIEDEQGFYREREIKAFRIMAKWVNKLQKDKLASEAIVLLGPMQEGIRPQVEYEVPKPFTSEKERVELYKLRLTSPAINTLKDIITMDNPGWTEDQIQKKLEEVKAEAAAKAPAIPAPGGPPPNPAGEPPKPPDPAAN